MATGSERSVLRVEGPDDLHVVRHVFVRHGLVHDESAWFPSFMVAGDGAGVPGDGRIALLRGVRTAVRLSEGKAVGFVLDADDSVENNVAGDCGAPRNGGGRASAGHARGGLGGPLR